MSFGVEQAASLGECDKETSFAILDRFVALGGNFIDTANSYQNGQSEVWVGEWMQQRKNRDQIVLATKFSSAWKASLGHEDTIQANYGGNGAKSLHLSVADSLAKLQTSYIDLLYVHWWDYTTDVADLMHDLNSLVVSGKVLYLGISDTPAWVVAKANTYASAHGLRTFSVYQGLWNASIRDLERDILPMCKDQGMAVVPWGAIGQGRFQTAAVFKERETNNPGRKNKVVTSKEKQVSLVLEKVGEAHGASIQEVALAYILHKSTYVCPIIGCRKMEHLESNVKALDINLSADDIEKINAAYDFRYGFPHDFLWSAFEDPGSNGATRASDVWLTRLNGTFDWVEGPRPIGSNR